MGPDRRVEVWVADLDVGDAQAWSLESLLTDDERVRADRFAFDHLRRRFVVAHALLRTRLGPAPFDVGGHGKPTRADGPFFNLSHSGERALLAVCDQAAVGVDVEQVRPLARPDAVAERIMSPAELAGYRAAADPMRFLLEVWTSKEAVVKATGEGITRELRSLTFDGHALVRLNVGPDYVAALAVDAPDGEQCHVEQRQWP
ncbi:MAG: 4-phosphopantetheinyl transferase [Acidimicrobiaceae bacterium]|nr:4-phosphopantetheinyl transferase [Acidimicrobiaceae bacterium]